MSVSRLTEKLRQILCLRRIHPHTGEACPEADCSVLRGAPVLLPQYSFPCYGFYPYGGSVKKRIHAMKFDFARWIANELGDEMCSVVSAVDFDMITWVPLHYTRIMVRGYNPSQYIARRIARFSGKPLARLLVRTRRTKAQSSLKGEDRLANPVGAFSPVRKADIRGKHILLTDDVVTLGATLDECTKVLYNMGAASVTAVVYTFGGVRPFPRRDTESERQQSV